MVVFAARLTRLLEKYSEFFDGAKTIGISEKSSISTQSLKIWVFTPPYRLNLELDPNQVMDDILSATKNSINTIFPLKRVTRKQAELIQNLWLSDDIIKESKLRD